VFPTDTAVQAAVKAGTLNPANVDETTDTLKYHLLKERVVSSDITGVKHVQTNLKAENLVNQTQVVIFDLSDGKVTVNGLEVVTADYLASDGAVHTLGGVLSVPTGVNDTLAREGLTTLITAIAYSNLTQTVENDQDITIFAPSNAAFQKCDLAQEAVPDALTRHIFAGVVYSDDLSNDQVLTSIGGDSYKVTVDDKGHLLKIDNIPVTKANVLTSSGVVYELEYVLGCGPKDDSDNGSVKWWQVVLVIAGVVVIVGATYHFFCKPKRPHAESLFDRDDHSGAYVKYGTTRDD
jgi:uncharacterized surface protein with fasciclin (FAS1) repeats